MPKAITQRPQQEVAERRRGHQHVILYAHLSIRKVRHIFGSNGEEAEGHARGASDSTGNQQIAKAAISLQDTQPDARAGFTSGAARSLRRLRRRDAWDAARLASERKPDKRDEHHSKSDRKAERKVGWKAMAGVERISVARAAPPMPSKPPRPLESPKKRPRQFSGMARATRSSQGVVDSPLPIVCARSKRKKKISNQSGCGLASSSVAPANTR